MQRANSYFHLHLVSDATGETLTTVARAATAQYALETIEGPYLPLVVLEAAGLPLDSSFAEQKKILERCKGLFYACAGGAEARRFNRLLIGAGLIRGL